MSEVTVGQISESLKLIAGIIASSGTICGIALFIFKKILNKTLDDKLEPFEKRMDNMEKARIDQHKETNDKFESITNELNKNSLNTMKNTICNENIPLSERIEVGKEYIEKGGNGAVKIYYHKLEEEYEKKLQKEDKL